MDILGRFSPSLSGADLGSEQLHVALCCWDPSSGMGECWEAASTASQRQRNLTAVFLTEKKKSMCLIPGSSNALQTLR